MNKSLGIPQNEQNAAAKYFAMSNTAVLDLTGGHDDLHHAYDYADSIVQMETGYSLEEERRDWLKECKKAKIGSYVAEEWSREKVNWKF
jgi:hypothetical protein